MYVCYSRYLFIYTIYHIIWWKKKRTKNKYTRLSRQILTSPEGDSTRLGMYSSPAVLLMNVCARGSKHNCARTYTRTQSKMAEILLDTIVIITEGIFFYQLHIFSPPILSGVLLRACVRVTVSNRIRVTAILYLYKWRVFNIFFFVFSIRMARVIHFQNDNGDSH